MTTDGASLDDLTDAQRGHLLEVAANVIRATVGAKDVGGTREVEPGIAGLLVDGAFASLHAGEQLRACCGHIGGTKPLGETVVGAAGAACRDHRFRSLRAEELDGLTLELSLLYAWRTETVAPAERPSVIEVGTHGLMLRRGYAGGLLLPVVGRRYGWSPEEFLEQTCRKASLPKGAWRDADVQLETFKALEIEARFGECR